MVQTRVLVMGPRRGLIKALEERKIAYAVWSEDERISFPGAQYVVRKAFSSDANEIEQILEVAEHGAQFTHVFAGTESAVMPASICRRIVGARQSVDTVILRCRDKLMMKEFLRPRGIPMTDFVKVEKASDVGLVSKQLGFPVVVKARMHSGARGIQYVQDPETLARHVNQQNIFERYVDAPEYSVESFVDKGQVMFSNITEYLQKQHINVVPALLPQSDIEKILELNEKVIRELDIEWGTTHLEVYLRDTGPLFGEVALRPPGGYIMDLISEAYNFSAWAAYLNVELGEAFEFPKNPVAHAAAWVIHPGAGLVKNILGWSQALNHPMVTRGRLKIKMGDTVRFRTSVGEEVGHLILRADRREKLLEGLHELQSLLKIQVESSPLAML